MDLAFGAVSETTPDLCPRQDSNLRHRLKQTWGLPQSSQVVQTWFDLQRSDYWSMLGSAQNGPDRLINAE